MTGSRMVFWVSYLCPWLCRTVVVYVYLAPLIRLPDAAQSSAKTLSGYLGISDPPAASKAGTILIQGLLSHMHLVGMVLVAGPKWETKNEISFTTVQKLH